MFWKYLNKFLILVACTVLMGARGVSPPDPLVLNQSLNTPAAAQYRQTTGLTPQQFVVNPAKKTLVLYVSGQSNGENISPTTYIPTNSTAVFQLNIFDGAIYNIPSGGILGSGYDPRGTVAGSGMGNVSARVADTLVTLARFDFVIIVNMNVGGTSVANWSTGGPLFGWGTIALQRVAAAGITCTTTGVTCAWLWQQGEQESALGTSQAAYTASFTAWANHMIASGFVGRFFICEETWAAGSTYANVQNAQIGIVDGVTYFSGGNADSLNAANRLADNTHWNDIGSAADAALIVTATHASGAPF